MKTTHKSTLGAMLVPILLVSMFACGGSGDGEVNSNTDQEVVGSHSGSVFYYGSPTVTRTGTGSGKVVQLSP